jgi:hypothetical protein
MTHGPSHGRLSRAEPLANPTRARRGCQLRYYRSTLVAAILCLSLATTTTSVVLGEDDEQMWSGDWLAPTAEGVFGTAGEGLPPCAFDRAEREAEFGPHGSGKLISNLLFTCDVVFSDPRLSGTQTTRFSERCWTMSGGCVNWGTMEIVGEVGGWSGWFQGLELPSGETDLHIVLTGSGAYEGLTNVRHASGGFWDAMTQTGVIYDSDPPPLPAE